MIEIINNLYQIGQVFLIGWLITHFIPFQTYVVGTLEGINKALFKNNLYVFFGSLIKILTCHKCLGLWLGYIMTGNIYIAIISSIIGYHYDKLDSSQKIKL